MPSKGGIKSIFKQLANMHSAQNEFTQNVPLMTTPVVPMEYPNEIIPVHQGLFSLITKEGPVTLNGHIELVWFPKMRCRFEGIVTEGFNHILSYITFESEEIKLFVNDFLFGPVTLLERSLGNPHSVKGVAKGVAIMGDKTVSVSVVNFAVANFLDLMGGPIKYATEERVQLFYGRTILRHKKFEIVLDKSPNYNEIHRRLSAEGGFSILYSGSITKDKGPIFHDEIIQLIEVLAQFFHFINGRRSSPLLLTGIHEGAVIWKDYSPFYTDQYMSVTSWSDVVHLENIELLWSTFFSLCENEETKFFLIHAIHWYVEANASAGFTEGSIIMAQTCLELMYNWLLLEQKKLITESDGHKLSASNKIRLLLAQIGLQYSIPPGLTHLTSYADEIDGPEIFTQVRNSIVHGQKDKRSILRDMPLLAKYEALQLGIWYIELILLYILKYNGKYKNRTSQNKWYGEGEVVPWKT